MHRSPQRRWLSRRWLLLGVVICLFALAACSSGATDDALTVPTGVVAPTDEVSESTAETDSDSEQSQPAETSEPNDSDPDDAADDATAEVVALDESQFDQVVNLEAGDEVVDDAGNVITMYAISRWPANLTGLDDLLGGSQAPGDPEPVALDIGFCAAGLMRDNDTSIAIGPGQSLNSPFESRVLIAPWAHPIASPSLAEPVPGECTRGWIVNLAEPGQATTVGRYLVSTAISGETRQVLYQWTLEDSPSSASEGRDSAALRPGQSAEFSSGLLAEASVEVRGWTEFVDRELPEDNRRLVGLSVELCRSSTGAWPTVGLAVDGWNALGPTLSLSEGFGDPALQCDEGWLAYSVPFGLTPTGAFVSGGGAGDEFVFWTLEGAAVATPS